MTARRSGHPAGLDSGPTRLLVAVDGSPVSSDVIAAVRDHFDDSEVIVVSVVDGISVISDAAARSIVDRACSQLGRAAHRVTSVGSPAARIGELVEVEEIEVVAIGAPGPRWRLRPSTARLLLRYLDCDILVVPPSGGADSVPVGPQKSPPSRRTT